MKRLYLPLFIGCFLVSIAAQPSKSLHYRGGMQYHVRYIHAEFPEHTVSKAGSGLGGRLAFAITPNIRIGGMGFSSSCTYNNGIETHNFSKIGFGGLTAECVVPVNRVTISAGICAGGGSLSYLYTVTTDGPYKVVRFDSNGTIIFDPFMTIEYSLTKRVSATVMFDWLFADALPDNSSFGPAIHLGILFGH
jgi:hypothetical protein